MALSPDDTTGSRPNPRRAHRRRYRGVSDEQQRQIFQRQRDSIVAVFDALEDYFCAELDVKLANLDEALAQPEPTEIDAEFTDTPERQ
jgi:hypothetical protein